jgi:hypothetical protein
MLPGVPVPKVADDGPFSADVQAVTARSTMSSMQRALQKPRHLHL